MTTCATTPATITAFSCAEIPIWVCGKQLWISGVDRKTTVDQVVETLLGRSDKQYSIVEKWRQVERPLSGDTRILKLWKTWGDSKTEVKLSLKKIQNQNDIDTNTRSISTKKKTRYYKSACSKYGQTIHPKRLVQLSKSHGIERLLKLILVQGETIQNQICKLKDRQFEIEQLECEQHKSRIDTLGTNYLVNTYLGMSEDKDSGVTTECVASSENNGTPTETEKQRVTSDEYYDDNGDEDGDYEYDENNGGQRTEDINITIEEDIETEIEELRNKIYFLDKIVKINKKLEKEEENLVRLFINIERCKKDDISTTSESASACVCASDELGLRYDLDRLQNEIEKRENEFDNNCKILQRVENNLETRKYYLKRLRDDFYDETNRYDYDYDYDHQPFASCGVRSITQNALPYYTCAAAAATTTNKPVLNTLV
ncbi:ras association domain-containing protein 10 [Planococcus citri]|uniref:ras association domain-containing protein 10 n=1 Tax=Planococcus citri TaxID=170843 RepID=UPI0031F8C56A